MGRLKSFLREHGIPILNFTLCAAMLSVPPSARAAEFIVKTTPCKGFVRQDGKWSPLAEIPFQKGQTLQVRPVTGRQDIGYIQLESTDYTVPLKCLAAVPGVKTALPKTERKAPGAKPSSHLYLYGGALSWNETLAFTSSAGTSHPLYASQMGGALGGGYLIALGRYFDLSLELSGFFLVSDATAVAPDGTANPDLDYELSAPASVFGARFQPGIAWHSPSRFFSAGLAIPLVYRIGNWPIPPNGTDTAGNTVSYSIAGLSAFAPGVMLETRFRFGKFLLMPRGGIYGGTSNLIFDIGFGIAL